MLNKESIFTFVRVGLIAGAAAVVAACSGGGGASSPLPIANNSFQTASPVTQQTAPPVVQVTSTASPTPVQETSGSAYAPSSITVAYPAAPKAGDVLVVALWNNGQNSGAANTYTPPSGWSPVDQNTAHTYLSYQLFKHVVASGETGRYAFKPLAAEREHVWMAMDVANTTGVDKYANAYVSGTSYATPSLTPSSGGELALVFNMPDSLSSLSWSTPSGWTRKVGPTSVWSGEGIAQNVTSTSAVSETSTISSSSQGFAGVVLLKTTGSTSTPSPTATPASTPRPNPTPTQAPTPSPTSSPTVHGQYAYHGCKVFTSNDWLTTNLVSGGSTYVTNTVDPNSANIIRNLTAAYGNIPFNYDVQPTLTVANIDTETNVKANPSISGLGYGFGNDPENDDPSPHHIPITSGTFYQEGTSTLCSHGDCHVVVLDTVKCLDYETYRSGGYSWNGSTYSAQGGGVENLNHPFNTEPDTVTAADIPMMGTADWGEDLAYQNSSCQPNCAIPHTLAVLMPIAGKALGGHVAPAYYGITCTSYCTNKLPYGARLRLRSSYTCPSYSSYPQANLLCNQAKQYGWIFNDTVDSGTSGGGVRLADSANGTNPWKSSDYGVFLSNVKITDFDVMTLGTIH
jgi:hypothetical protein